MKTNIEYVDACLVAKIKLQLIENFIIKIFDQIGHSS
jgi:hypothetical protein